MLVEKLNNIYNKKSYSYDELVDIETWINDKYFIGDLKIYDFWKNEIINIFKSNVNEVIFSGATGTGKSFSALVMYLRILYELSILDFYSFFDIDRSSLIVLFYLSVTQKQAFNTGFGKLMTMIDTIPYFVEKFKREDVKSRIEFRQKNKKIDVISGSSVGDFIGSDLYAILLDEANFLGISKYKNSIDVYEKAKEVYRESSNRRRNRFIVNGKEYGYSIIVSSSDTINSFVEERIRENKNAYVCISKKYLVKPEMFSGKKFYVYVGDERVKPFIVDDSEYSKFMLNSLGIEKFDLDNLDSLLKLKFVDVPIEYYDSFKLDCKNSLKEVCGISVFDDKFDNRRLILDREKILNNVLDDNLKSPFIYETFTVDIFDKENNLIVNLKDDFYGKEGLEYVVGLDLSLSGDGSGISLAHNENGICVFDLVIKIKPVNQISLKYITEFIDYLINERYFNINTICFDKFASDSMKQYYIEKGLNVLNISVDRNITYVFDFVNAMYNNIVKMYNYNLFFEELFDLCLNKDVVIHTEKGKDIFDSMCRAFVYLNLLSKDVVYNEKSEKIMDFYIIDNKSEIEMILENDLSYKKEFKDNFEIIF